MLFRWSSLWIFTISLGSPLKKVNEKGRIQVKKRTCCRHLYKMPLPWWWCCYCASHRWCEDKEWIDRLKQSEFIRRKEVIMSEISSFDAYQSEFLSIMEQIKSRIQSKNIDEIDGMLKQAEDLVKQMGLEARGMDDAAIKQGLLAKVRWDDVEWHVFDNIILKIQTCILFLMSLLSGKRIQRTTSKPTDRIWVSNTIQRSGKQQ